MQSSSGWWQEVRATLLQGLAGCLVAASGAAGEVSKAIRLDLGVLRRHQAELWHCTDLASDITLLTDQVHAAMKTSADVFARVQRQVADQQSKLQILSREHGTGRALSLHSEVAAAAAGAPLTPAMQHLISSSLGEAGLKRASKDVDAAAQQLTQGFVASIQPSLERLASSLSSMLAITRCTHIAGRLGLQARAFQEAASTAQQLIADASKEHHEMLRECTEVRLFLAWLLQLAAVLQDDDSRSPALSATSRKMAETNIFNDSSVPAPHMGMHGQDPTDGSTRQLAQQHLSQIQHICSAQFASMATTLSAAITSKNILDIKEDGRQWHSCTNLLPNSSILWLGTHAPHSMVLVRTHQDQVQAAELICPTAQRIVQSAFYKEELIAVVLESVTSAEQPGNLFLVPIAALPWAVYSSPVHLDQVLQAHNNCQNIEDLASRTFAMSAPVNCPLILSGSRGLACVLSTMQQASMYDLEEEDSAQADAD
ncbi:hypothetical protein WJX74_001272 [Apatococcus lobatus]|uniref:Anaphase-promoting complex subunit 4 n=1 Tax=Apatococcus lobatus TaxID=904363 RepID=A0AAW1SDM1_9CHLO